MDLMTAKDQPCDRCGINLRWAGTHYHCGGCDSTDVTSMMGHFNSGHWKSGKFVKTESHHCTMRVTGECDFDKV